MVLKCEQGQAHVGKDEVLSQEIQQLKQLKMRTVKHNFFYLYLLLFKKT